MQKSIVYFCALLITYGYAGSISVAQQNTSLLKGELSAPAALKTAYTLTSTAAPKVKTAKKVSQYYASSSAVWGRIQNRIHLAPKYKSRNLTQRHIKSYRNARAHVHKILKNSSPYLYFVTQEVEKRGMPSEIALLPFIESEYNPHCRSHAGALGMWQLMPVLGRMHGLKSNQFYDGRKDVYESTRVALNHLAYLHKRFKGNWLHAIAAYNAGETRVKRAIERNRRANRPTDFWSLNLPKETTHFVPKLMAISSIIHSPKQYGIKLPHIPNKPFFARVNTGKAIPLSSAAKLSKTSVAQLKKLNPAIRQHTMSPSGPYHILVPIAHSHPFKPAAQSTYKVAKSSQTVTRKKATAQKKRVATAKRSVKRTKTGSDVHIHTAKKGKNTRHASS